MTENQTLSAIAIGIALAAGSLIQLAVGYGWRRMFEAKDEKISKLEERVDEMDTRRLTDIERDVMEGSKSRRTIYNRLDAIDQVLAKLGTELGHAMNTLPKLEQVSEQMVATAAVLERVVEQVRAIEARQFASAEQIGAVKGRLEKKS